MMTDSCSCVPPCGSSLAWVANWCTRDLDEHTQLGLRAEGALLLPSPEVVQSLLMTYFVYVNTLTPYVSEWDTCRLVREHSSKEPPRHMSLALLNAIMFAASGVSWPLNKCLQFVRC
jgi:hypothetical protein